MQKTKGTWYLLTRLFGFIKAYRKFFAISACSIVALSILGPLRPFLIGKIVDAYIVTSYNGKLLLLSVLGVLFMLMAEGFIQWLSSYCSNHLAQSVIRDIRQKVFAKLMSFKIPFFDKSPVGNLVTRVVSDVEAISEVFSAGFMDICGDILSLIFILGFMFYVDWQLACLTLIPIPLLLIATKIFARAMKSSFQMERTQVSKLNTIVQEHLNGMGLIQVFSKQKHAYQQFETVNQLHREAHVKAVWANSIFFPIVELLSSLSVAFLLVWGALNVEGKTALEIELMFGNIIAFTLWIQQLYRPIRQLADKFNILQRGSVRAERLFEILDDTESMQADDGNIAQFEKGDIVFKNVSFSYEPNAPIFKGLNLTIIQGKSTAFVGATGSGKTTLINLIGRFYDFQEGDITINGKSIQTYSLDCLRRSVGYVLQDVYLFSDSLHNNISLGNPEISRAQVTSAAQKMGAHDFIMALPGNYDHLIGEKGGALSVGQRQLIAFIRAMVYNPEILILDEATSNVDSESEELIQRATEQITKNRTSIIIAHRLSTIKKADHIVVLEKGEIKEQGTHKTLLKQDGPYKMLFEKQFHENS